jgi:hypothetical protein
MYIHIHEAYLQPCTFASIYACMYAQTCHVCIHEFVRSNMLFLALYIQMKSGACAAWPIRQLQVSFCIMCAALHVRVYSCCMRICTSDTKHICTQSRTPHACTRTCKQNQGSMLADIVPERLRWEACIYIYVCVYIYTRFQHAYNIKHTTRVPAHTSNKEKIVRG